MKPYTNENLESAISAAIQKGYPFEELNKKITEYNNIQCDIEDLLSQFGEIKFVFAKAANKAASIPSRLYSMAEDKMIENNPDEYYGRSLNESQLKKIVEESVKKILKTL